MEHVKQKTFRRFQVYSGDWHIENQRHIQNAGVMRARDIFRTLVYWEPEAYSELCQRSTTKHFAKIVNSYNYFFNIIFLPSLLYERNMTFLKAGLIFTLEVYILYKKGMAVGCAEAVNIYRYTINSKFV